MKGTWGRRVYGRVVRGQNETLFSLRLEMRNDHVISCNILVENQDIDEIPSMYGDVLTMMVQDIDAKLAQWN